MSTAHTAEPTLAAERSPTGATDWETLAEQRAVSKMESTLIAQFALRRHAVHKTVEGGYVVCRDGYARHCADLESLQAFAVQVGVDR